MPVDPNRWTQKTQEAFSRAVDTAKAESNPEVTPDHLLAVTAAIEFGGVNKVDALVKSVKQSVDRLCVINLSPPSADLPCAEADLGDFPAGAPE